VVAKAILGRDDEHSQVPWFWSGQYDVSFQYVGHTGEWDEIVWRGDPDAHRYSAFWLRRGRLVAALGANRPKDVKGARACMEAGIAVTPEQLSDPQVDLRKLTKAP
jgi:3-phenylpropionate/trans-cinnamate dioxygenase ferredoxin reductase subunit